MLRNYFKVAWRNIMAHRAYATINILGLSLGLAVVILIALYIRHETRYDKWLPDKEQVYRVYRHWNDGSNTVWTPSLLAQTLVTEFPEVEAATGLGPYGEALVDFAGKKLYVEQVAHVDSTFFDVLQVPFWRGDPATALNGPNDLVISRTLAQQLFGDEDPIGKVIRYDNEDGFVIRGVFDLTDRLTHLHYDLYTRFTWYAPSFTGNNRATYIKTNPQADIAALEKKITSRLQQMIKQEYADMQYTPTADDLARWQLQRVDEVHLRASDYGWLEGSGGNVRHIATMAVIALMVLLVAIVNYINLATSKAIQRRREVGIRKVSGAYRSQLITQFVSEAVLQAMLALILALTLAQLLLPVFAQITARDLSLFAHGNAVLIFPVIALTILTGVIAGYYPAITVSSYSPVKALKTRAQPRRRFVTLRTFLVSAQLVVSIALLVVMATVFRQVRYMEQHDLQFSPDQVLVIPCNASQSHRTVERLRPSFEQIPGVQTVSTASRLPGMQFPDWGMVFEGRTDRGNPHVLFADHTLMETLDLELVAGRFLSSNIAGDTIDHYVVNEQYAQQFGLEDPVGAKVKFTSDTTYGEIVGVVRDFHYRGLSREIQPLVIGGRHTNRWYAAMKLSTSDLPRTIGEIRNLWASVEPEHPMRYSFLDEDFNAQYAEQERFGRTLLYTSLMTIFIALLGMIGLTAFTVQRRTKEIGIRKVLGASVAGIVRMLSREFVVLVLAAFVVAAPLAWYLSTLWLQDFAFRSGIPWWVLAGAGLSVLFIVVLTVSIQSLSAAIAHPVDALRNE